ncbi:2-hydroxychromene-2-carboxylate isomerase [Variibacter gotjawalensis]|uniref:2-hydroxychromene-2-carboxylate isomerase n=1 Tax=Variibacter gotjawalensis TaxID=1333996 RepID=A0A0S3PPP2_9BRAD|nr:2-hydroxychromene-2-carboxylate isomerase [Variibacter gotjawalensis]NIK48196.1 2-hydroxychromene-2-carboxylate isomerase [Variibacter gotjawalensis]RZS50067.1 2-hydroxychromene-2-carboxylate isomerase [Variibacter gotjawalensis]BAT57898.1 2-hydroxychromene-2-carboxylate isomerase [Variibacter gotjawalensis]
MSETIDYYFSMVSPWAYIGTKTFNAIVDRHKLNVNYKPVPLGRVFAETGGLPLGKRHPARVRYRILELQRWREKRGLNFHLRPKQWPFDGTLADCFVVAALADGHDVREFVARGMAAVWEDEVSYADGGELVKLANALKLPGEKLLEAAKSDAINARYEQNYAEAVKVDAFGSPCFVRDGEVFWGQDRLELLDDAITSGRAGFKNDAV